MQGLLERVLSIIKIVISTEHVGLDSVDPHGGCTDRLSTHGAVRSNGCFQRQATAMVQTCPSSICLKTCIFPVAAVVYHPSIKGPSHNVIKLQSVSC